MKSQFWNNRYETNDTVYGYEPNQFLKSFIDSHKPGTILLPAEGEGRNAIYAAKKGWKVDAFDFSSVARQKAMQRAEQEKVNIHYEVMNIEDFKATKQ
jgi:2-polyprenyl-3-methyl-5-hydroxy-6-metoxy-1,4-benzoquinol methylase